MTFGLRNAAQKFQRLIDKVLNVSKITASLTLSPCKCVCGAAQLEFLGHHMDTKVIRTLEDKVQIIHDFPQPTSQRKIWEFLGLVNFYCRFLLGCARVIQPLNQLLSNSKSSTKTIEWNEDAMTVFTSIKEILTQVTSFIYPKPEAPTSIMTDASNIAVGAVLQQYINGEWYPIAYFTMKLKPGEPRYVAFDRELLAVYLVIKHFRHLEGRSCSNRP